ncbi:MAG TPA: Ig-like domain-containing protein [Thermodesulfobacteriota bacterium]|nr:Ig-like domain-containing protein [Thermodesulfobacteriota bacterium]
MRKVGKEQKTMRIVVFFALIIPLLFLGCSPKVSWISAQPREIELNKLEETFQIKAVALDKENKPVANAVIQWVSSDPEVAEVSNTGLLTAKGSGNSVITLTAPNTDAKSVIQCKVSILAAIKVEPEQLEMKVGEKHELEAKVLNEKNELFEDQVVGWASLNGKVAFCDDLGNVTAVSPGEATITATTPSKGLSHAYGKAVITVK